MDLELKLDFSSIYVYMYVQTYRVQKGCFSSNKNHHNYYIVYVNQHYVSTMIDGGELNVRCDLVLFTPVNLCTLVIRFKCLCRNLGHHDYCLVSVR